MEKIFKVGDRLKLAEHKNAYKMKKGLYEIIYVHRASFNLFDVGYFGTDNKHCELITVTLCKVHEKTGELYKKGGKEYLDLNTVIESNFMAEQFMSNN